MRMAFGLRVFFHIYVETDNSFALEVIYGNNAYPTTTRQRTS